MYPSDKDYEEMLKMVRFAIKMSRARGWSAECMYMPSDFFQDYEQETMVQFIEGVSDGGSTGWKGIYQAERRAYRRLLIDENALWAPPDPMPTNDTSFFDVDDPRWTNDERKILSLVDSGYKLRQIADQTGKSLSTVHRELEKIFRKMKTFWENSPLEPYIGGEGGTDEK
jgi:hypothetical protein